LDLFNQKILLFQQKDNGFVEDAQTKRKHCEICHKTFSSTHTFDDHVLSKKHKDALERSSKTESSQEKPVSDLSAPESGTEKEIENEEDESGSEDAESESDAEGDGLSLEECLFCDYVAADLEASLTHMSVGHGFFVPDVEFCVDVSGLMSYLGKKVGCGFVCLWCNSRGRMFRSLDAVQKHMRDRQHCKLLFEGNGDSVLEFAEFYDYSSSYPDDQQADAELPVPEPAPLDASDWQLVLPSGATIGHRSLVRYYRQRLKGTENRLVPANKANLHGILANYRKLGWTGATDRRYAELRAKDLRFMRRAMAAQSVRLGQQQNKLQRYFKRDDIRSKAL